jgi:phage tail sheath gpL-like
VQYGAGQLVMTPKLGKAEAVGWFEDMQELGLVENVEQFIRDLVVERNAQDPNRLDFLLPPDLINQLMVVAAQVQFRL